MRAADAAALAARRSSSKTSVSAQSWSAASGRRNPRESRPTPTSTDAACDVLGALDRRREDVVVRQQLDRALGAARRVRDEDNRVPALAAAADLGDPFRHAPGELDRRLTGDVDAPGCEAAEPVEWSIDSVSSAVALEPVRGFVPRNDQRGRRRDARALAERLVVARLICAVSFSPCARTSSGSETRTVGRPPAQR